MSQPGDATMPKSKGRPARARVRRGPTPRRAGPADAKGKGDDSGRTTSAPTLGRYTPPTPRESKHSPPWFGPLLLSLMALGALVIMLNYMGLVPGDTQNAYLYGGLGLITLGFILATQWR
jgi:hypothetical protein